MFVKNALKVVVVVIIALSITTVAYAYAAGNTVPATTAGDGTGVISGYTVTNVVYTLDATNPANISKVTFTLSAAATVVQVSVTGATPYTSCTVSGGTSVTCTFGTEPTVTSATSLRVIATQ
ncbi:MAG: hypothetical protein ABSA51_04585 [Anaerolineaceae bacterium]|jgi:hypothetical protein